MTLISSHIFDGYDYLFQPCKAFSLTFFLQFLHNILDLLFPRQPHSRISMVCRDLQGSVIQGRLSWSKPPVAEGACKCGNQASIKWYKRRKIVLILLYLQAQQ